MHDYTIIICTISIFHCVNLSIITSYAIISSSNTIMICTVTDNFGKREVYTVCSSKLGKEQPHNEDEKRH